MSAGKKLLISTLLIISVIGVYFYYSKILSPEVLQAATAESFETFSVAKIEQYPTISYSDSLTVPLQSRLNYYRTLADTTKFTQYLCSPTTPNACTGYTPNPTFIRLNFDAGDKLILFNNFSLFSIVESSSNPPSVKWQSTTVDRFSSGLANTVAPSCNFKYDPNNVLPIKNGSNYYYLYTRTSGINTTNCLQHFDRTTGVASNSAAAARLYLGYEIASNGELNRNYTRNVAPWKTLSFDGPYGPGPQNATFYATSPVSEILGCSQFDTNKNCLAARGAIQISAVQSGGGNASNTCVSWGDPYIVKYWVRCANCVEVQPDGNKFIVDTPCASTSGTDPKCPSGSYINNTWAEPRPELDYTKQDCLRYQTTYSSAFYKNSVATPAFTNFSNYTQNSKVWNLTVPTSNSSYVWPEPAEYTPIKDELANNNTDNAINFTNDFNKTVFTTNNYLFKITQNTTSLSIDRYTLTPNSYSIGGTSYINNSSKKTVTLNLKNSANTKFSLQYFNDDILILAANPNFSCTTNCFDIFRITNFNSENATITYKLFDELKSKLAIGTATSLGNPVSLGVIGSKAYFVTSLNKVVYSNILSDIKIISINESYKYVQFNGNVFSDENNTSGMLTTPSSKYVGNYITSNSYASNISSLKFFNNSQLGYGYLNSFNSSLLNFNNFTGTYTQKFNYLYASINFAESTPLQDSQYLTLPTNSTNNYEIISIGTGRGLRIDLTNANIVKSYNKYILMNLDKNPSRIMFYVDCNNAAYSIICSGVKFNFKSSVLGQFYVSGNINTAMLSTRFVRIHENADVLINLMPDLKKKKYPTVSSTLVNLNYE